MSWSIDDYQFFEFCLYEATHLIGIGFICLIIKPLWTLAMGRPVLIIVFSKAIMALIDDIGTLLQRTSNRVKWDVFEATLYIWRLENDKKLMHDILQYGILFNITALAFNRMHCIMWPFHYNGWISKKKIVAQSILIWILAILIATGMHLYNDNGNKYTYQASLYIIIVAIGLYMIVGAKLAWKKFYSDELSQSASEKDFYKITIVCLSGLMPILFQFLTQFVTLALAYKKDQMLNISLQIVLNITGPFFYCGDEFCLILLLADFRKIIKKFLRSFFGRWTNYNGNNSSQNVVNIIVIPISKNGMPPISSVAPYIKQSNEKRKESSEKAPFANAKIE